MLPGDKDTRTLRRIVNMKDIDLDPLVRIVVLSADHLALVQDAVHPAKIDRDIAADESLDNAGDDLVFLVIVIREQTLPLRLADLLKDDVLRVLHGYTAKCPGVDVHIDDIAQLAGAVDHLRVCQADLGHAVLDILNHFLCKKDAEGLLLLIQGNDDIRQVLAVEVVPASLLKRFRDRLQKHLAL